MAERETSQSIDAAAADWVAREDRAPLSRADEAALQDWLEGDSRRPGALLRARAVSLRSESARALGPRYDPADFSDARRRSGMSRRQALTWGGAAAASVAAVAVVGVSLQAPRAHATERGEIRLAPLGDGSTALLNTETRVTVKYDDTRRRVKLVEGEVYFTVLADARRPFVVEVDGRRISTSAGAFRVRRLKDAPIDLLVDQGRVEVATSGAGPSRPVILTSNTRLVLPASLAQPTAPPQAVAPDRVTRDLAWRDGKIAFEGETLAQAAAAFARYSDTRIVIEDPDLAREPVTGLFAANDPAGFGHAVAGLFGRTARTGNGTVVIS
jgi:transmembrane sensor